jgi:UDP:flavonoid glycosyltransferase YjiC (YdhE family)
MSRRVLLVCWGSQGDVAPLVTLGRGLRAAGDDVSVLAPRDFADLVTSAGLGFLPFEIDLAATAGSAGTAP